MRITIVILGINNMKIYNRFRNFVGHVNSMKRLEFKRGKRFVRQPLWFRYFPSKYNRRLR